MAKEITDSSLRRINSIAGVLHLAQMLAVLALASDFTLPITARYMSGPPGSTYGDAAEDKWNPSPIARFFILFLQPTEENH